MNTSRLVYTTSTLDARIARNKPVTIAAMHYVAGSGKSAAFTQDTCTCDPCRIQRCEIEGNTARPCEQLDACTKCGTPLTSEERLLHAIFGTCPPADLQDESSLEMECI